MSDFDPFGLQPDRPEGGAIDPNKDPARHPVEIRKAQILTEMRKLATMGDPEWAHGEADGLLLEMLAILGQTELVEAWGKVPKWYA